MTKPSWIYPTLTLLIFNTTSHAAPISNPCAGWSALLFLLDRPTRADSACVVSPKQIVLETGYEYANLQNGAKTQDYPEGELRIGLPLNNEFVVLLPDYNTQTIAPSSGYNATQVGIKHEIGYNEHWLVAIEGLLGLPTGGGGFGSDKYNPVASTIITYTFNPAWSLTFMIGIGTQSLPPSSGGQRYTTINPDFVLSWLVNKNLESFGEVYGQNRTSPNEGSGINADVGLLYLFTRHLEVDAEVGQRLRGNLEGFNHYYGVGLSFLFG